MLLFAGFDIGGTHLKYGLVDDQGFVLFEGTENTPATADSLFELIKSIYLQIKNKAQGPVQAVGLGFPGIFSIRDQRILQSPHFPAVDRINLVKPLSRIFEIPFYIQNEANLAAFGEYKKGTGTNTESLVLLTIGTGIGAGIILSGRIWTGACGFAGELGHIVVNPDGRPCKCGSQGCLETEVAAPGIVAHYQEQTGSQELLSAEEIFQRAQSGDQKAVRAFSEAGKFLGIGIATVINLLNPEKILLGGGVINARSFLLVPALKEAKKRAFQDSIACSRIREAALGNKAGFIGAALWAKERLDF